MDYDLLVFGGSVYMGEVARPLKDYLSSLRFRGRQVLLFAVGDLDRSPELASLRAVRPGGQPGPLHQGQAGGGRPAVPVRPGLTPCIFPLFRVEWD